MKHSMKSRLILTVLLTGAIGARLSAQTPPPAQTAPEAPSAPATPPAANDAGQAGNQDNGNGRNRNRRGNFNPADIQARMLSGLREQMGVTDDAEWNVISPRLTAVMELRRTQMMGTLAGLGGFFGGGNRGNRGGGAMSPEQDALRSALDDNLPDAEITSRLTRLREVRKQNEATLDKARDDLRAVLTVRQEAVAVMAGLLN